MGAGVTRTCAEPTSSDASDEEHAPLGMPGGRCRDPVLRCG